MNIVQVSEKTIVGLGARTNNKDEMNPGTGKIGPLVHQFDANVQVDYRGGARVYSVYHEYESDVSGNYSVLVGADKVDSSSVELIEVKIQEGNYLVFTAQGQVPHIVIETWGKIWTYFASPNCSHTRAYLTDFEFYKSQNEIEIYIGIK
ncbi:transcriptional regulator [Cellvibrio zantedeschiae]|uniref:Transcriptional regulator n=1 Tax=Cellvibrio zantedeschiae TaxID=1237077 RepID=A0ABQ3B2N8_9GAMM|nr:GyrI-like domain-containing protein [Cellvibrio zantedeschiae]GGY76883.1 transcriptional regulator [Cellvibrio zantedeschiae]